MKPADELFDAMMKIGVLRDRLENTLLTSIGVDVTDVSTWPLDDITFDWYDSSFEFKGVRLDWEPTPEMQAKWWELGFERCWICYKDKTEKYYASPTAR